MAKKFEKYKKGSDPGKARDKKTVLIILSITAAFVVLYFAVAAIVDYAGREKPVEAERKIQFSPVNYGEDITSDEYYMGLDRQIYFENRDYGTTVAVTDDELSDISTTYRPTFKVLYNYVNAAISGDCETLNGLFSRSYYEAGGKKREKFTAQKLYNIKITYTGSTTVTHEGASYDAYSYTVEYMIRKNNGTFRDDMGSDCVKREYFTVCDYDGKPAIDEYAVYKLN